MTGGYVIHFVVKMERSRSSGMDGSRLEGWLLTARYLLMVALVGLHFQVETSHWAAIPSSAEPPESRFGSGGWPRGTTRRAGLAAFYVNVNSDTHSPTKSAATLSDTALRPLERCTLTQRSVCSLECGRIARGLDGSQHYPGSTRPCTRLLDLELQLRKGLSADGLSHEAINCGLFSIG
jgi:hypothetical protein